MNSLPGFSMEAEMVRKIRLGALLLTLLAASAAASVCLGPVRLPPARLFAALGGIDRESAEARILLYSRLPRTLAALVSGAALAVSGAVIQSVLENPLAAPNVIGVNTGAGFAVAVSSALWPGAYRYTPLAAFLGALAGVLLVLFIGERSGASRLTLVLAGIAVSSVFSGGVDLVVTFAPDTLNAYTDFRIGGFSGVSLHRAVPASVTAAAAFAGVLSLAPQMEILSLGADTARSLGLRVRPVRFLLLTMAAALSGAAVSMAGLLGFVGLIVPHAARRWARGDALAMVLFSALGGGVFVALCDVAARTVFAPYEIPVGVVLSLLGGPFFLWLVLRQRGGRRHA